MEKKAKDDFRDTQSSELLFNVIKAYYCDPEACDSSLTSSYIDELEAWIRSLRRIAVQLAEECCIQQTQPPPFLVAGDTKVNKMLLSSLSALTPSFKF